MAHHQTSQRWVKALRYGLLAVDSWIDAFFYESGQRSAEYYIRFSHFMDRFYVSGLTWLLNEIACEALTLCLGGAVLALMLAQPAFNETSDDWLKKQDIAVTFLDRHGDEVGRRGILHDDSVPFEQWPDYFIKAVLATEDRRFFDHFGIDIVGTARAIMVDSQNSRAAQGGSTITQQLAKNLFLTHEKSIERKIKEAFLALWLEHHVSKREILKLYLDRVYMGAGTFGAQAAAEFYFGKSIKDITLAESAMLAGLFKAPTKYAPHVNLAAARARANDVLSNLVDAGFMTEGQVFAARKNPATAIDRQANVTPDWYLDWAYDEVKRLAQTGAFGAERTLVVRTALDLGLQKKAEASIEDALRDSGPRYHAKQSATVIMEPNGAVRAIVGGRDYGDSQFNRATEAQRQPGSSFKPFVYTTALMIGKFTPDTIVEDAPVCVGNWCPHNFGGTYAGHLPLWLALTKSLNTVAVRLSIAIGGGNQKVGRTAVVQTAHKMGITTPLPDTPSLVIGADSVTVIDMASAYCTFANGGHRAPPFAALEVRNARGQVLYRHAPEADALPQIIPAHIIEQMVGMMTHVVEEGTARAAQIEGVHLAGKTGTTNESRDAWFVGYSGNFVEAIWFGNDDNSPMESMTGGSLPARTWHEIMAYAHNGVELKPLPGDEVSFVPTIANIPQTAKEGAKQDVSAGAPVQNFSTLSKGAASMLHDLEEMTRPEPDKRADGAFHADVPL